MEVLEKLYKKHDIWCNIVKSFGCDKDLAEDVVQDMYLKIAKLLKKGTDISYGDDVNYFYIYKTLTSIFLDYVRKNKRIANYDFDLYDNPDSVQVDYIKNYEKILDALDNLYWYDRKVYEIVDSGESIRELSRKTGIAYHSLYNTYRKVKKYLKNKL
jgi:DNA-directed RNA polymerase specialized sigma24 family protein